jgi:crotonobetainyl-CoA:carnitine CoA-transferase CaiB-like acyl-CoA transferase
MARVLDGVRVIDLTSGIAGPGSAMYLADQGAEVVRIEPPPTEVPGDPLAAGGTGFVVQNRNKRSVTLNLGKPEGKAVFRKLVERSDVLINNMRLSAAAKLGVDYPSVRAVNPRLIYGSITAYGTQGPYAGKAGYDRLTQGFSGAMYRRWENGTPVSTGIFLSDPSIPMLMGYGIALALLQREKTGEGQIVETSLLQAAIAMQMTNLVKRENSAEPLRDLDVPAYGIYRCSDDTFINVTALLPGQFRRLCTLLDIGHVADDPRANDFTKLKEFKEDIYPIIEAIFETKPSAEWLTLLDAADVPAAPVLERDEVFNEPQMVANNMFVRLEHPTAGPVLSFAPPLRLSGSDPVTHRAPSPLGEHTGEVLGELGYRPEDLEALRSLGVV